MIDYEEKLERDGGTLEVKSQNEVVSKFTMFISYCLTVKALKLKLNMLYLQSAHAGVKSKLSFLICLIIIIKYRGKQSLNGNQIMISIHDTRMVIIIYLQFFSIIHTYHCYNHVAA